jgi:exopolysaccharide biosynthesis WecB/TagA/CpsF family protein
MSLAPESATTPQPHSVWPRKVDLFGVGYTPTTYQQAADAILQAAENSMAGVVACHAVHAVVTCSGDAELKRKVNQFDMLTPDGQPVRWGLNLLYGADLPDRVYGPELMRRLCERAAAAGVPVYFYGGNEDVSEKLVSNFKSQFPGLIIAGFEAPPFRALTEDEDDAVIKRINNSGARIVFIGLGCPKQDEFAYDHRESIHAVQVCVGAAFDFHAGVKSMAPDWMQRRGLEWLYRLIQEPGRLWRRYFVTNSIFVVKLGIQLVHWPSVLRQRRQWRLSREQT